MKRILSTIVCLLIAISVKGQNKDFEQKFYAGFSFGSTVSSVSFVPKVIEGMKTGWTGGATFRWITENHLGLQGEINFSQQGWSEKYEDYPEYYYKRTLNYIEIPFLTHIYFGGKKFRFFINLGPKIGFNIGESTSENLNGLEINNVNEQHNMSVEKPFDWGLCGGPGLELHTGIGTFILEGRYYYALGDVFKSRKEDYFSKSSSQVITGKVAYLIPLNIKKHK